MSRISTLIKNQINSDVGSILNTQTDWVGLTNKTNTIKSSKNLSIDRPGYKLQEILGFELGIYDTVYSGAATQFKACYWAHESVLSYDGTGQYTETNCRYIARLARDGGLTPNGITVRANSIIILDFEGSTEFNHFSSAEMIQIIQWVKNEWPSAYVIVYSWAMPVETDDMDVNLNHWANMSEPHMTWFDAKVQRYADVYNAMDAFGVTFYLLGSGVETRDFQGYGNYADRLRHNFPHLNQFAYIWGAYHDAWNPPNSYIPQPWLDAYIIRSSEIYDGVSVWNPNSLNNLVPRILEFDKSRLIKPAYRATTVLHTPLYRF